MSKYKNFTNRTNSFKDDPYEQNRTYRNKLGYLYTVINDLYQ